MDVSAGERISLIGATVVLIVGMMYVSVEAAEDARRRNASGRDRVTATAAPSPTAAALTDEELLQTLRGERRPTFGDEAPAPVPGAVGPRGPGPGAGPSGPRFTPRPRVTPPPFNDDPSVNPSPSGTQPKAGRYDYTSSVDPDERITFRMEPLGGGRYREHIEFDEAPPGLEVFQETVWSGERKVQDKETSRFAGEERTCDWQPDLVLYQFPLRRGATWQTKGACTQGDDSREREMTFRVLGAQRLQVGGRSVDVWVIEGGQGSEVRDYFAPDYGVTARVEDGDDTYNLRSLDPR